MPQEPKVTISINLGDNFLKIGDDFQIMPAFERTRSFFGHKTPIFAA